MNFGVVRGMEYIDWRCAGGKCLVQTDFVMKSEGRHGCKKQKYLTEVLVKGTVRLLLVDLSNIIIPLKDNSSVLPLSAGRMRILGFDLEK
jgi:hypothetical protein